MNIVQEISSKVNEFLKAGGSIDASLYSIVLKELQKLGHAPLSYYSKPSKRSNDYIENDVNALSNAIPFDFTSTQKTTRKPKGHIEKSNVKEGRILLNEKAMKIWIQKELREKHALEFYIDTNKKNKYKQSTDFCANLSFALWRTIEYSESLEGLCDVIYDAFNQPSRENLSQFLASYLNIEFCCVILEENSSRKISSKSIFAPTRVVHLAFDQVTGFFHHIVPVELNEYLEPRPYSNSDFEKKPVNIIILWPTNEAESPFLEWKNATVTGFHRADQYTINFGDKNDQEAYLHGAKKENYFECDDLLSRTIEILKNNFGKNPPLIIEKMQHTKSDGGVIEFNVVREDYLICGTKERAILDYVLFRCN